MSPRFTVNLSHSEALFVSDTTPEWAEQHVIVSVVPDTAVAGMMRRQSDRRLGEAAAFDADDRLPLAVFPHFLVAFDLHIVSPPPVYVNGGRNRRRIVVFSSV